MSAHSLNDIVEFVNKHKGTRAFRGYNDEQIMSRIMEGVKNGTYMYATDENGKIVGVIYGRLMPEENVYYVENMVASERWVMRNFAQLILKKWPNYYVKAFVHDKKITFTVKALDRIANKK